MKNYRLYLVRHGVTQGNLDGIYMGSGTDQPLCAQGAGAAARVGRTLSVSQSRNGVFKPYAPRGGDCGAAVPGRKG